uniref:Uncharacterized protein n=1 Tax=Acrobeloides nanus TaxID=290746 RepID=A0A914EBA6_9BILA
MSELSSASPVTIWMPPASGPYSKEIWAPEIHHYDGKFYVYFAADDGNNDNHRIFALENASPDPTFGTWTFKGKVSDPDDKWAIDASSFEYKKIRYFIWAGFEGTTQESKGYQNIYIAKLSNPWTIDGYRVKISSPIYDWEMSGGPPYVNEAPEGLVSPQGNLFITYSASVCWSDNYALGLLSLQENGDPLNATHWTKSPTPVFKQLPASGAFATGHNGFFKSLDGSEDWLLYHANSQANQGCGNSRNPRIQKFTWNADGTPNFGVPVKINTPIPKPSGEQ